MSIYSPPNYTQPLSIFNPANYGDDGVVITKSYLDTNYLKYPTAQGLENLQAINVNGVLTMSNTDATKRSIRSSYFRALDVGNVDTRWSQLSHQLLTMGLSNICNGGDIKFLINDAGGSQVNSLTSSATTTTINTILQANSTSEFKRPMIMNDTTDANNRKITSTFYDFYDAGSLPLSNVGTIYNQSGAMYIQNTFNGGSISLVCDEAGGAQQSPLQVSATSVLLNKNVSIATNTNLTMNAGTGIISQPYVNADISTRNSFKLADFRFNSGATLGPNGTATAFEFYDDFNAKGLFLLPNSGSGSLSQTNRQNDCCLTSRGSQHNNTITISNWNSNLRNGLRVSTTDTSNCNVALQCGQSDSADWTEFRMAYNRATLTTTSSFNNVINFNPTTPSATTSARRRLEGLGTLSFTDLSGNNTTNGSFTSAIWTDTQSTYGAGMFYDNSMGAISRHTFLASDSTSKVDAFSVSAYEIKANRTLKFNTSGVSTDRDIIGVGAIVMTDTFGGGTASSIQATTNTSEVIPGMIYDCNINGGFHIFKCNDSLGVETAPVYYGTNLTSISNTLVVRNATTTSNRFDISVDGTQLTSIRARSATNSTNASININCDSVSALGVVTNNAVLTIATTNIEIKRPIQFNYSTTPSNSTQLGYLTSATIAPVAYVSSAIIQSLGSFSLGIGTWAINCSFTFLASGNHSYTVFSYGINTANNAFPTTMPYLVSYVREPGLNINTTTASRQISMTLQLLTATTLYFPFWLVFGGGGNTTIGVNYTYTRIG